MIKSVKIMYFAESGALWVVNISFINWLWIMAGFIDHFFVKFESILFPK